MTKLNLNKRVDQLEKEMKKLKKELKKEIQNCRFHQQDHEKESSPYGPVSHCIGTMSEKEHRTFFP